jgi:L-fucose isomerase-like protein
VRDVKRPCIGLIVGNRNFFPDALVEEGRRRILSVLEEAGIGVVTLSTEDTKFGAVERREDAEKCARLFREHAEEIEGIIITLPNFGDERAAAEAVRLSGLNVPVLVHAFPDELGKLDPDHRRDAFCGKISLCNSLKQFGIEFTDTTLHVEAPESQEFKKDLENFLATCRVVKGLKAARLGAVGARPTAFNTVRYSEKLLESYGITVETLDLSEVIARANKLDKESPKVKRELEQLRGTFQLEGTPNEALQKMARLSAILKEWIVAEEIDAFAFQCWTAIEEIYGIVPCAVMSLFSESMIPAACEVDVMGALAMYVLELASGQPAALMDWNNNFGDDPDKIILFHCSNFPPSFFANCKMSYQHIIAGTVGKENTYGTVVGKVASGPATFLRLSTLDTEGQIAGVVTEGNFTDEGVKTFGGYGVAQIPGLRPLLREIVRKGLEHHIAVTKAHVGKAVAEALKTYLAWEIIVS